MKFNEITVRDEPFDFAQDRLVEAQNTFATLLLSFLENILQHQFLPDLIHYLLRLISYIDCSNALRFLQSVELTPQKVRIKKVPHPRYQSLTNNAIATLQVNKNHILSFLHKTVPI